ATAEGFWQPEQHELTEPYVQRYFAELPDVVSRRSSWLAERLAEQAYPALAVSARTRQYAAELLARPELSAVLRRVVQDQDDDMARALAARR
ncbi:MAG TPA: aminopeptidase N, partial [Actinoplanes sp.]|nr:aminopeptidase N [Actinoplanes sp.]